MEHALQDIVGAGVGGRQPIGAGRITPWCERFGGDGAVDTLAEWLDCIVASAECTANQAGVMRYPRALEWFDQIRPAMLALVPLPTDAIAALDAMNAALEGAIDDDFPDLACGSSCGDGVRNGRDECDGSDLGGSTCVSLGFARGPLACTPSCNLGVTRCVPAGQQAFPPSGQTTCWNTAGTTILCTGTGQDGERGRPLAFVDNGDGTISDLNTGLMWEKKSDDESVHDHTQGYTWQEGVEVFVPHLNRERFAGYGDWRLPNVKELQSIVNYGTEAPAVHPAFHTRCAPGCTIDTCSCTVRYSHLSSTTVADDPTRVWDIDFTSGDILTWGKTGSFAAIRAVRGGTQRAPEPCAEGGTPGPSPSTSRTATSTPTPRATPTAGPGGSRIEILSAQCHASRRLGNARYQQLEVTVRAVGPVDAQLVLDSASPTFHRPCNLVDTCEQGQACRSCTNWSGDAGCPDGNGVRLASDRPHTQCTLSEWVRGPDDTPLSQGPNDFVVSFFPPNGVSATGTFVCPASH